MSSPASSLRGFVIARACLDDVEERLRRCEGRNNRFRGVLGEKRHAGARKSRWSGVVGVLCRLRAWEKMIALDGRDVRRVRRHVCEILGAAMLGDGVERRRMERG